MTCKILNISIMEETPKTMKLPVSKANFGTQVQKKRMSLKEKIKDRSESAETPMVEELAKKLEGGKAQEKEEYRKGGKTRSGIKKKSIIQKKRKSSVDPDDEEEDDDDDSCESDSDYESPSGCYYEEYSDEDVEEFKMIGGKLIPNVHKKGGQTNNNMPDIIYWALYDVGQRQYNDQNVKVTKQEDGSFELQNEAGQKLHIEKHDIGTNERLIWDYLHKNKIKQLNADKMEKIKEMDYDSIINIMKEKYRWGDAVVNNIEDFEKSKFYKKPQSDKQYAEQFNQYMKDQRGFKSGGKTEEGCGCIFQHGGATEEGKYQINVHGEKPTDYKIVCKIIRQSGKNIQLCYHETNDGKIKGVELYSGQNYIVGSKDRSHSRRWDLEDLPAKYKLTVDELKKEHNRRFKENENLMENGGKFSVIEQRAVDYLKRNKNKESNEFLNGLKKEFNKSIIINTGGGIDVALIPVNKRTVIGIGQETENVIRYTANKDMPPIDIFYDEDAIENEVVLYQEMSRGGSMAKGDRNDFSISTGTVKDDILYINIDGKDYAYKAKPDNKEKYAIYGIHDRFQEKLKNNRGEALAWLRKNTEPIVQMKKGGKSLIKKQQEENKVGIGINWESKFTEDERDEIESRLHEDIADLVEQDYTSGEIDGEEPNFRAYWEIDIQDDEEDETERIREVARQIRKGNTSGYTPTFSWGANVWNPSEQRKKEGRFKKGGKYKVDVIKLKTPEEALKELKEGKEIMVKGYDEDWDNYTGITIDDYEGWSDKDILSTLKDYKDYQIWGDVYQKGGKTNSNNTDMDYEKEIAPILKEQIVDAFSNVDSQYELNSVSDSETAHKSYPGFIPFTDGGWNAQGFQDLSWFESTGKGIGGTEKSEKLLEQQVKVSREYAIDWFKKEYPKIVKELGEDNINYYELEEKGYTNEAEELDSAERDNMSGDDSSVMFELGSYYYTPENYKNPFPGKHSITIFGNINFEAPYFRPSSVWEDYIEEEFSFNNVEELSEKLRKSIEKILDWFGASKNYAQGGKMSDAPKYKIIDGTKYEKALHANSQKDAIDFVQRWSKHTNFNKALPLEINGFWYAYTEVPTSRETGGRTDIDIEMKKGGKISTEEAEKKYEKLEQERQNTFSVQTDILKKFEKQNPSLKGYSDMSLYGYLSGLYKREDVKPDLELKNQWNEQRTLRHQIVPELIKIEKQLRKTKYFNDEMGKGGSTTKWIYNIYEDGNWKASTKKDFKYWHDNFGAEVMDKFGKVHRKGEIPFDQVENIYNPQGYEVAFKEDAQTAQKHSGGKLTFDEYLHGGKKHSGGSVNSSVIEEKSRIEKLLSDKGVTLIDFDQHGWAANGLYQGHPIEGYNYEVKGETKELPSDVAKLIDNYNSLGISMESEKKNGTSNLQRGGEVMTEEFQEAASGLLLNEFEEFEHNPKDFITAMGWRVEKYPNINQWAKHIDYTHEDVNKLSDIIEKLMNKKYPDKHFSELSGSQKIEIYQHSNVTDFITNLIAKKITEHDESKMEEGGSIKQSYLKTGKGMMSLEEAQEHGLTGIENEYFTPKGLIAKMDQWQKEYGGVHKHVYDETKQELERAGYKMPSHIIRGEKNTAILNEERQRELDDRFDEGGNVKEAKHYLRYAKGSAETVKDYIKDNGNNPDYKQHALKEIDETTGRIDKAMEHLNKNKKEKGGISSKKYLAEIENDEDKAEVWYYDIENESERKQIFKNLGYNPNNYPDRSVDKSWRKLPKPLKKDLTNYMKENVIKV